MKIRVKYRADTRLSVVELRTGNSVFLGDLVNFLDMSKVDISESTSGEAVITAAQYSQLKREGAVPNAPRRPKGIKPKSYEFD